MVIFELSWSWYEDYSHWLFEHPTKTQRDFEKDCQKALREFGDEYLQSEKSWASAMNWIEFITSKLPVYGYKAIKTKEWGFWGGYILEDDDKDWAKLVGKELFEKALKHNNKLQMRHV